MLYHAIKLSAILFFCTAFVREIRIDEARYEVETIRSLASVYKGLQDSLGIQCPRVVVAQICLETNFLRSDICKANNNLFGMKASSRGWHVGSNLGHAKYLTRAHSLIDYRDWQRQMSRGRIFKNDREYIYFLGHLYKRRDGSWARYATDTEYEIKLLNLITLLQ